MHDPVGATALSFPVHLEPWVVASFRSTREQLRRTFGPPHYVETDGFRTAGGDEDNWAWELATGQRVLVVLGVPYGRAIVYCDPPDAATVTAALGLSAEAHALEIFPHAIYTDGPRAEAWPNPNSRSPKR